MFQTFEGHFVEKGTKEFHLNMEFSISIPAFPHVPLERFPRWHPGMVVRLQASTSLVEDGTLQSGLEELGDTVDPWFAGRSVPLTRRIVKGADTSRGRLHVSLRFLVKGKV